MKKIYIINYLFIVSLSLKVNSSFKQNLEFTFKLKQKCINTNKSLDNYKQMFYNITNLIQGCEFMEENKLSIQNKISN